MLKALDMTRNIDSGDRSNKSVRKELPCMARFLRHIIVYNWRARAHSLTKPEVYRDADIGSRGDRPRLTKVELVSASHSFFRSI